MNDNCQICELPPQLMWDELIYGNDRAYHDVTWLTAHNAFSSKEEGWLVHYQQNLNIDHLFDYGVRSFMLDIHYYKDDIYLCHEDCGSFVQFPQRGVPEVVMEYKKLEDWLINLKTILESNPNEIITLHLENYVKSSDVEQLLAKLDLKKHLVTMDPNSSDLKLGKMRKDGTNLVVFNDYAYDRKHRSLNLIEGIHPTTLYKETHYSLEEDFKCKMREDFRATPGNKNIKLFLFNHFPAVSNDIVNDYKWIMNRINICKGNNLSFPNFIAVDFVEKAIHCGDAKDAVIMTNFLNKFHHAYQADNGVNNNDIIDPQTYGFKYSVYGWGQHWYENYKFIIGFALGTIFGFLLKKAQHPHHHRD